MSCMCACVCVVCVSVSVSMSVSVSVSVFISVGLCVCVCVRVCCVCVSALCVRVSMHIHGCVLLPSATKVFPADVGRAYTRFLSLRSASQLRHSICNQQSVYNYTKTNPDICMCTRHTHPTKQPLIHPPTTQPTTHLPANQMALLCHAAGKCQCSFAEFRVASTC